MMRRIIASLSVSIISAFAFHLIPVWNDSFAVVEAQGQHQKVFYCGWPFRYAIPLELEHGSVVSKLLSNVLIVAVALLLLMTFFSVARRRGCDRSPPFSSVD